MRRRLSQGSGSRASRDRFTAPRGSSAPVRVPQTRHHNPRCWVQAHGLRRCMHVHRAASMDRVGARFTSMTGAQDTQRRSPRQAPPPKACHGWPLSRTSAVLPCADLRFLNVGKPVAVIICRLVHLRCARFLRFGPARCGASLSVGPARRNDTAENPVNRPPRAASSNAAVIFLRFGQGCR